MPEAKHEIRKIMHPARVRYIEVLQVARVTPRTVRVTFGGEDLADFETKAFDNHVKLIFPLPGQERPEGGSMETGKLSFPADQPKPPFRDYTPRAFRPEARELDVEFTLHGEGPASSWASAAQPGQVLGLAGPKGSLVVSDTFDWHLLAGDDTALPAISRRLEELPAGARAVVVLEVEDSAEHRDLTSKANVDIVWIYRAENKGVAIPLLDAIRQASFPEGDCYAWVAGETEAVRAIRKHLIEERGLDKTWMKTAGYWRNGAAGVHDKLSE